MGSLVLEELQQASTEEYTFLTSEILNLLSENGYQTHCDSYDELVALSENDLDMTFTDMVDAKNKLVLSSVCADFGIKLTHDITTREMFKIASGLLIIEHYDNKEVILDVCDGDYNTIEKIATILSYVTSELPEYFMLLIDEVNPSLIARIKEHNLKEKDLVDHVNRDQYVANLNKVCNILNTKDLFIVTALIEGLNVGFEMKVYLDMIAGKINTVDFKRIAAELLCITVISSDTQETPLTTIRSILPIYIHDELKYTAIDKEYSRLLLEYTK